MIGNLSKLKVNNSPSKCEADGSKLGASWEQVEYMQPNVLPPPGWCLSCLLSLVIIYFFNKSAVWSVLLPLTPLLQVTSIVIVFWCLKPAIIGSCFGKLIWAAANKSSDGTDLRSRKQNEEFLPGFSWPVKPVITTTTPGSLNYFPGTLFLPLLVWTDGR